MFFQKSEKTWKIFQHFRIFRFFLRFSKNLCTRVKIFEMFFFGKSAKKILKVPEIFFGRAKFIKLGMYFDRSRRDLSIGTTFRSIRDSGAKFWPIRSFHTLFVQAPSKVSSASSRRRRPTQPIYPKNRPYLCPTVSD